jgi:putative transposase
LGVILCPWYNFEHRHSGLSFGKEILDKRKQVYEQAREVHPERWSGDIRNWTLEDEVWLNPERSETKIALSMNVQVS